MARSKVARIDAVGPTEAQMARDDYVLETQAGLKKAVVRYSKVRQLEKLLSTHFITDAEYRALKHYRHHADIAEKSLTKDSLAKFRAASGGSDGIPFEVLNAIQIAHSIEQNVGRLWDILRAVVVEDKSLSQWAMEKYGSRDHCKTKKGKVVCYPAPHERYLKIAQMEFKYVAGAVLAWG